MKNEFSNILNNYLQEIQRSYAVNDLANFIRNDLAVNIKNIASIGDDYKVEGSAGRGRWAFIPWVCIFDREITTSAERGYFIVYLFDSKMNGLYLSLNQGWTQYKNKYRSSKVGREEIEKNTNILKSLLPSTLVDFSFNPITLNLKNDLGIGYEFGHICGKFYQKNNIPEDSVLVNDLRNLIGVYRELKGLVGNDIFNLEYINEPEDELNLISKEKIEVTKKFSLAISKDDIEKILLDLEKELQNKEPRIKTRIASAIARNKKVADLTKQKYQYECVICGYPGFKKNNGQLYAEVHHKEELARGGHDLPSNLICVCPICHRILHYGNDDALSSRYKG